MRKLIIDRFEGTFAVCESEDKSMVNIPKYKLPPECREGDCIAMDLNGIYQRDIPTAIKREQSVRDKMNRLFRSN